MARQRNCPSRQQSLLSLAQPGAQSPQVSAGTGGQARASPRSGHPNLTAKRHHICALHRAFNRSRIDQYGAVTLVRLRNRIKTLDDRPPNRLFRCPKPTRHSQTRSGKLALCFRQSPKGGTGDRHRSNPLPPRTRSLPNAAHSTPQRQRPPSRDTAPAGFFECEGAAIGEEGERGKGKGEREYREAI